MNDANPNVAAPMANDPAQQGGDPGANDNSGALSMFAQPTANEQQVSLTVSLLKYMKNK